VTPWNYQFDVGLDKTFRISGIDFTAYIYVQNIFNKKNEQHVYGTSGVASGDNSYPMNSRWRRFAEDWYGEYFFPLYDQINLGHRQHYQIVHGGDLFGHPREIRFGVRIELGTGI
jgi:hypothetical protein